MGISSLGIGSGIDTASMLQQIQASEQTRLTPLTNLQTSYKSKISAWGQISSALSALQKSVKSLGSDAFSTMTVSDNKAFTATASSGAQADTHEVTVEQMAQAHKLRTETKDSADTDLGTQTGGTRTITITQKDGSEVKVELSDDETSLNDIAKAINKEGGNVTATVQKTGSGYQLALNSKSTGTDGEMSVKVDGDGNLAAMMDTSNGGQHVDDKGNEIPNDPGAGDAMIAVSDAKDAIVDVDGSQYTRSSNNISDILDGITLKLKSVSEKDDSTPTKFQSEQLTLTQDTSAIKTNIQAFVKQYNSLLGLTTAASKYVQNDTSGLTDDDVATQSNQSGPLVGDSTLRGLVSQVRSTVNANYGDSGADYSSLADLGIKIDASTGQMTLDEDTLDSAIADDPDQISKMFTDTKTGKGLSSTMSDIITSYIGDSKTNTDGLIKTATDGLNDQTKQIQEQIDKTQKLIDGDVERYRKQFEALDTTMSQMNNMSSQITSLMSSL
ncbi:Flagellar cap protein [Enterobacter sp. DC4]|uniref:flagellar filament capping protein FliD n=1 Tax=Enterobacter sp. DC4 TaxID=1395580 RepID=UPI0003ED05B6|nr:flagellar filament capping protein FliD [Enterobacter sp. DC4]EWG67250.1 Flagellar cap protein [Enterobacter sp. DC4]